MKKKTVKELIVEAGIRYAKAFKAHSKDKLVAVTAVSLRRDALISSRE